MKRIFFVLFFLAVIGSARADSFGNVTILIYHKFGEDQYPTTNVAVERFDQQMAYLRDNGYTVVSLADLAGQLEKKEPLPDKAVVITIDDGYTSTYTEAWPILKKYGYPCTIFLYVKAVDRRYTNFLTWEQVEEMQEGGVDFQDHGYSHHRFGTRPDGLDEQGYCAWITEDLSKGRAILTEQLGAEPEFLALPYGEYNEQVMTVAADMGYRMVVSQDPGSVSRYSEIMAVPREPILGNDWATMAHFKEVLERRDLPFVDMTPPRRALPALPEKFCATLLAPERYLPSSLGIYVSELGWQPGVLNGDRLCIENTVSLQRRSNRVAISGREKASGQTAIRYWLLFR